ncbi:FecCD family ABC transporter permease [Corynebacterium diphtheriae]
MTRTRSIIGILCILLVLTPAATVSLGPAAVPFFQVYAVIASHIPSVPVTITWDHATDAIVWQTRLPRIVLGLAVGATLGVSGVAFQALIRNSLAEPYVLGVSSGAGAALALISFGVSSAFGVGAFAFVGAALATTAVVIIAGGGAHPLKLILSGLAVGFGAQSLTNLVIFSSGSPETNQAVMFWMLGSLSRARWSTIGIVCVAAVIVMLVLSLYGPILDALASGDSTARSVGVEPVRTRALLLLGVSAAVAIAVSAAGGIGFVGLIIPHVMRQLVGYSHRVLVVASGLASAVFLVWADAFARIVFSPQELPIGVITGLIGTPCLALIVRNQKNQM